MYKCHLIIKEADDVAITTSSNKELEKVKCIIGSTKNGIQREPKNERLYRSTNIAGIKGVRGG